MLSAESSPSLRAREPATTPKAVLRNPQIGSSNRLPVKSQVMLCRSVVGCKSSFPKHSSGAESHYATTDSKLNGLLFYDFHGRSELSNTALCMPILQATKTSFRGSKVIHGHSLCAADLRCMKLRARLLSEYLSKD